MAREPHNAEGDAERANEASNSAFLFGNVAVRGDTHRLARLLLEGLEQRDNWFQNELGVMLTHQLGAPLELELAGKAVEAPPGKPASEPGSSPLTFRDVLFSPATSLAWLVRVKEYAKARLLRRDPCFPPELARVLYYGSLLAARARYGERITSLTDAECRIGVDWVIRQDWVEAEVREWFRLARGRLMD